MLANNVIGDPEKSLEYGERSLAIARDHNLEEQLAYTLHDLARPLAMLGHSKQAMEASEEAGRLFREQNNLPMVVDNMATASSGYYLFGQLDLALERAEEALSLSRSIGSLWGEAYASMRLAFVLAELGYVGQAAKAWDVAGEVAEDASFIGIQFFVPAFVAYYTILMGSFDRGEQMVMQLAEQREQGVQSDGGLFSGREDITGNIVSRLEALQLLGRGKVDAARALLPAPMAASTANSLDAAAYGLMTAIDGRVLLAAGEYKTARTLIQGARSMLEGIGIRVTQPVLQQIEAQALLALGHEDEAILALRQAADEAREMNARRQLWPILGLLARLADARDATEAALALRREARDIIELMAGDLDEELRSCFLALPEVREAGGLQ